MGKRTNCCGPSSGCRVAMSLAAVKPRLALCVCFSYLFYFSLFLWLCGSPPSRCDLLRFSEVWSGLTGTFMHLVFPPFLPSGSLKSKFRRQLWSVLNVFVCFFLLLYVEIFALVAPAEQMFLGNNALLRSFHARTIWHFFWGGGGKCFACRDGAVQRLPSSRSPVPYKPPALWCDTIPPPAAVQPALPSPWDERRTKTDKLTVVCNLLVKAKWKRSTAAFNLAVEPCSSIFSSTFQKLHWSGTCFARREVAGSQPGVYLSSLLISPPAHSTGVNPVYTYVTDKKETAVTALSWKYEVPHRFLLPSWLPWTCHIIQPLILQACAVESC